MAALNERFFSMVEAVLYCVIVGIEHSSYFKKIFKAVFFLPDAFSKPLIKPDLFRVISRRLLESVQGTSTQTFRFKSAFFSFKRTLAVRKLIATKDQFYFLLVVFFVRTNSPYLCPTISALTLILLYV
jgi:hypothetical protein